MLVLVFVWDLVLGMVEFGMFIDCSFNGYGVILGFYVFGDLYFDVVVVGDVVWGLWDIGFEILEGWNLLLEFDDLYGLIVVEVECVVGCEWLKGD